MRQFLAACSVCALLAGPAAADEGAIQGVISDQLSAFIDDDFDAAFSHASPAIRQLFGTSQRFGSMVRNGYPMVHRPQEVRFLDLRDVNGRLVQRLMITDAQGTLHMLDYQMIETADGWRINGVQIVRAPQVGA